MKIASITNTQYTPRKQVSNQPAFGMKIEMTPEAVEIAKDWFPATKLKALLPEIAAIRTKGGLDIHTRCLEASSSIHIGKLRFIGTAEGAEHNVALTGLIGEETVPGNPADRIIDRLIPTLREIAMALDEKIDGRTPAQVNAEFLKKVFPSSS